MIRPNRGDLTLERFSRRTMAEESPSSEEPRRHRGVSARGRELLDRGAPSSSTQRPVPFISIASIPKPSQPYTHNPIDPNMPAAAFVAGAAIQEANQAAHIAHHAASMAEQQAIEAMRARQFAAQAEEHATQVQSQAQFVVHETRQQAENMVGQAKAQAEAMVGHVRAQAEQYVQSQQHEHVQRQRQLEQQAHQWASGVEGRISCPCRPSKHNRDCRTHRTAEAERVPHTATGREIAGPKLPKGATDLTSALNTTPSQCPFDIEPPSRRLRVRCAFPGGPAQQCAYDGSSRRYADSEEFSSHGSTRILCRNASRHTSRWCYICVTGLNICCCP